MAAPASPIPADRASGVTFMNNIVGVGILPSFCCPDTNVCENAMLQIKPVIKVRTAFGKNELFVIIVYL
jgi:hypothetical protein